MAIKKGDRLRYTGTYAPGVAPYPEGIVVGFRKSRHGPERFAIVELPNGHYADFPTDEVEKV